MTSGQPIHPPNPRRHVTRRRPLVAGVVGLHLVAATLWLLLATGEASAGPQPLATVPASASGSASPMTAPPPTGSPAAPPASAHPPTLRSSRGGAHHHAPTPSPTAVVVPSSPSSTSPPSLVAL